MASLTPVPEIFQVAILWRVVKVPCRKYNSRSSDRVGFAVTSTALRVNGRTLANITASISDLLDNFLPVIRIPPLIFWLDWHYSFIAVEDTIDRLVDSGYDLYLSGPVSSPVSLLFLVCPVLPSRWLYFQQDIVRHESHQQVTGTVKQVNTDARYSPKCVNNIGLV